MDLNNFNFAPLYTIDKEWALLTSGYKDKFNTMTVSWGGMGTLWHKPIVTVYVRPNRYTFEFLEKEEYFTLSFYDAKFKEYLGILGSKSGRDTDKIALTNLTPEFLDKSVTFKEANLTIVCKKIFTQKLNIEGMSKEIQDSFYKDDPVHHMFIGEVIDIIDKR